MKKILSLALFLTLTTAFGLSQDALWYRSTKDTLLESLHFCIFQGVYFSPKDLPSNIKIDSSNILFEECSADTDSVIIPKLSIIQEKDSIVIQNNCDTIMYIVVKGKTDSVQAGNSLKHDTSWFLPVNDTVRFDVQVPGYRVHKSEYPLSSTCDTESFWHKNKCLCIAVTILLFLMILEIVMFIIKKKWLWFIPQRNNNSSNNIIDSKDDFIREFEKIHAELIDYFRKINKGGITNIIKNNHSKIIDKLHSGKLTQENFDKAIQEYKNIIPKIEKEKYQGKLNQRISLLSDVFPKLFVNNRNELHVPATVSDLPSDEIHFVLEDLKDLTRKILENTGKKTKDNKQIENEAKGLNERSPKEKYDAVLGMLGKSVENNAKKGKKDLLLAEIDNISKKVTKIFTAVSTDQRTTQDANGQQIPPIESIQGLPANNTKSDNQLTEHFTPQPSEKIEDKNHSEELSQEQKPNQFLDKTEPPCSQNEQFQEVSPNDNITKDSITNLFDIDAIDDIKVLKERVQTISERYKLAEKEKDLTIDNLRKELQSSDMKQSEKDEAIKKLTDEKNTLNDRLAQAQQDIKGKIDAAVRKEKEKNEELKKKIQQVKDEDSQKIEEYRKKADKEISEYKDKLKQAKDYTEELVKLEKERGETKLEAEQKRFEQEKSILTQQKNAEIDKLKANQVFYTNSLTQISYAQKYSQHVKELISLVNEINKSAYELMKSNKMDDDYNLYKVVAKFNSNLSQIDMSAFMTDINMISKGELVLNTSDLAKGTESSMKKTFFFLYLEKYVNAVLVLNENLSGLHYFDSNLSETDTKVFSNYRKKLDDLLSTLSVKYVIPQILESRIKYPDIQIEGKADVGQPSGAIISIENCQVWMAGGNKASNKIIVKVQN